MSARTPELPGGRSWRRVYPGPDQVALRSVVVLGAVLALLAALGAGSRPAQWELVVAVLLAGWAALRPESPAGVALLLALAYVWALGPDAVSPLVLVASAGMLAAHVAATVAAQGPARMRVDGAQALRWAARGVLLWLVSVAVWGLAVTMSGLSGGRAAYALGLGLLAVLAVGTTVLIGPRATRRR